MEPENDIQKDDACSKEMVLIPNQQIVLSYVNVVKLGWFSFQIGLSQETDKTP